MQYYVFFSLQTRKVGKSRFKPVLLQVPSAASIPESGHVVCLAKFRGDGISPHCWAFHFFPSLRCFFHESFMLHPALMGWLCGRYGLRYGFIWTVFKIFIRFTWPGTLCLSPSTCLSSWCQMNSQDTCGLFARCHALRLSPIQWTLKVFNKTVSCRGCVLRARHEPVPWVRLHLASIASCG